MAFPEPLDAEIFDDRVGEEPAAHFLDLAIARLFGQIEFDQLACPNVVHA
jgi:hypothetical protein